MRMRLLPVPALLAVLAFAAWWPDALPQGFAHQDKLHHLLGFAVFAIALRFAAPERHVVDAGCIALVVAAGLELGQLFVPARTPSLPDLVASVGGAGLGLALDAGWRRRGRHTARPPDAPAQGNDATDRKRA